MGKGKNVGTRQPRFKSRLCHLLAGMCLFCPYVLHERVPRINEYCVRYCFSSVNCTMQQVASYTWILKFNIVLSISIHADLIQSCFNCGIDIQCKTLVDVFIGMGLFLVFCK